MAISSRMPTNRGSPEIGLHASACKPLKYFRWPEFSLRLMLSGW
jgi:hypothetical protein